MTGRRLSAAALLGAVAAATLLVYMYWWTLAMALVMWCTWRTLRWRTGLPATHRERRTVLELVAAGVGAWWLARKATR